MASENVTKAVSLKDYIIDMKSATVKGVTQYEVVLENNTDFIVRRQTATTCRELVILVSKGLYYIKDCKTGHIEELKEQTLNSFLRELKDGMIALNQVHWLSNLYRESVGLIMQVITDETLTDMCRHNVLVNTFDPTWYTRYWKQNRKLFTRLYNMFPNMADRKKYQASIPVIFWIEQQYGANEAMFFAEKLVQSGITELDFSNDGHYYYERQVLHEPGWFLKVMASPHRINLRRFIDYILFDLYAQGYGVDNVALLTPFRKKSKTGVYSLNAALHDTINPASQEKDEIETGQRILRVGDKVMQMKNRDFASNGDIGYICTSKRDSDGILVEVDFGDDRVVAYEDAESLRQVELAYAATIHKSQGSEYDAVLINIQNMHGKMLNRALIYTAETRAKKQVIIVGDWEAVVRAIQTADTKRRNTMLAVRINDLTKE